ncbi:MAG: NAD(P)-dependent oxidoreductase [Candidatus Obscuribacterales bacterium]|nr:NAD(P)-dependent oxidoreductase [Candidatus Obscuribacterales bacterium]
MNEVIVLTGSTGRIGNALAKKLHEDFTIVGLDIVEPDSYHIDDWLYTDFTDTAVVKSSFNSIRSKYGRDLRAVVHLVAYYDFSGKESPLYKELTVNGTRRVLDCLKDFDLRQFVYTSSHLVHAPCDLGEKIREEDSLEGKWEYPESKIEAEKLIKATPTDFCSVIYRIAGVYDDYCNSLPLSRQIRRIYERSVTSAVYPGDIKTHQPYIHMNDVVSAIALGIKKEFDKDQIFLLAEPNAPSYDDLQRVISKCIYGEEWETAYVAPELAKAGAWVQDLLPCDSFIKPWMVDLADDNYELDIAKAASQLNWHPVNRVLRTIEKMVIALKNNPSEWFHHHGIVVTPELDAIATN